MACMERAHGGHKAREPAVGACLPRHLLHPLNSVNDFHAAAARIFLMRGLCGALAVEADKIRADGLGAELAEQRGHLTSDQVFALYGTLSPTSWARSGFGSSASAVARPLCSRAAINSAILPAYARAGRNSRASFCRMSTGFRPQIWSAASITAIRKEIPTATCFDRRCSIWPT